MTSKALELGNDFCRCWTRTALRLLISESEIESSLISMCSTADVSGMILLVGTKVVG
jgi:hypothetical protein